ncbi:hypothetical protein MPER_12451 [Moniliophthora perniciosa FA553]|nr:hypothetical protein MPER_12451 [Moniliophthora perniciosa FA553]
MYAFNGLEVMTKQLCVTMFLPVKLSVNCCIYTCTAMAERRGNTAQELGPFLSLPTAPPDMAFSGVSNMTIDGDAVNIVQGDQNNQQTIHIHGPSVIGKAERTEYDEVSALYSGRGGMN